AGFGRNASRIAAEVLADRGVRFVGASAAKSVLRTGTVVLEDGTRIPADRVVAAPLLRGRRLTGVPADHSGFVPTDTFGHVHGLTDVYAVGDMTTSPIKHG